MEWWEHLDKLHNEIMTILNNSSDQVRSEAVEIHDKWYIDTAYSVGEVIQFDGKLYRCLTAHTSQETWKPDVSPSLWTRIMYRDGIRIIPDVIEATQAFAKDEYGWWGDDLYRSLIDGNVWTPQQHPAGWEFYAGTEESE